MRFWAWEELKEFIRETIIRRWIVINHTCYHIHMYMRNVLVMPKYFSQNILCWLVFLRSWSERKYIIHKDGASASDVDFFMRLYVATIWSSTPSRVHLNSEIHFRAHINPFSIITIIKLLINIMIMNLLRFNMHINIYSFSTRFLVISHWSWNLSDISAKSIWWHQLTLLNTTAFCRRCC